MPCILLSRPRGGYPKAKYLHSVLTARILPCYVPWIESSPGESQDLIPTRSGLASFQLIQIPSAHGEIALILIHTVPETEHLLATHSGGLVRGRLHGRGFLLLLDGGGGPAAEPAAEGMADRGSDCYAAVFCRQYVYEDEERVKGRTRRWKPSDRRVRGFGCP